MKREIKERILRGLQGKKIFEDILRENVIKMAKFHRKHCNSSSECGVSLYLLKELLKGKYKIELTEEEEMAFL